MKTPKKKSKKVIIDRLTWKQFWDKVGEGVIKSAADREKAQRIAMKNAWGQYLK